MATSAGTSDRAAPRSGLAAVERILGRPLASYHLVLGSAGLLLTLGLAFLLSALTVHFRDAGRLATLGRYREQSQLLGREEQLAAAIERALDVPSGVLFRVQVRYRAA